jgi:hypothetical protein
MLETTSSRMFEIAHEIQPFGKMKALFDDDEETIDKQACRIIADTLGIYHDVLVQRIEVDDALATAVVDISNLRWSGIRSICGAALYPD